MYLSKLLLVSLPFLGVALAAPAVTLKFDLGHEIITSDTPIAVGGPRTKFRIQYIERAYLEKVEGTKEKVACRFYHRGRPLEWKNAVQSDAPGDGWVEIHNNADSATCYYI